MARSPNLRAPVCIPLRQNGLSSLASIAGSLGESGPPPAVNMDRVEVDGANMEKDKLPS